MSDVQEDTNASSREVPESLEEEITEESFDERRDRLLHRPRIYPDRWTVEWRNGFHVVRGDGRYELLLGVQAMFEGAAYPPGRGAPPGPVGLKAGPQAWASIGRPLVSGGGPVRDISERNGTGSPTGSGVPIESFIEDARSLGVDAFEERHGGGFLLLTAQLRAPQDTFSTALELEGEESASRTGGLSTVVFPVRSPLHIATLGRAGNNDVVIPDSSISRTHALVKRRDDGSFLILDASSSNGTLVNGQNVLVRGHGSPTELKPGDNVRMGGVDFTFVDAERLRDYAAKMD